MAADALEEMNAPDVLAVLRDAPVERAAELLTSMESDEAADALRDLPDDEREDVLRAMPAESARELRTLLAYEEETAGGVMTSGMVLVGSTATVGDAVAALQAAAGRSDQQAGVVVVDQDGRLLDDVSVFELLGVAPGRLVAELVGPPWPVTVPPSAGLREVVSTMTDNRGSSIVVVDEQERPVGRILADDVIDALTRRDDRRWPWQRWIGPSS
jgi:Mg/Co/Ni transporter MgtE